MLSYSTGKKYFIRQWQKNLQGKRSGILCGHYEGIDERVLDEIVTDYVSIGDYVLTGGELPAMVMMDSISRLVPGVLIIMYPQKLNLFPKIFWNILSIKPPGRHGMDQKVPEVLLSGHHANIEAWRREQSILRTARRRPDLLKKQILQTKNGVRSDSGRKNGRPQKLRPLINKGAVYENIRFLL